MFPPVIWDVIKQFGVTAVVGVLCVVFILKSNETFQQENQESNLNARSILQHQIDELNSRVDMCEQRNIHLQAAYDSLLVSTARKDENNAKILMDIIQHK